MTTAERPDAPGVSERADFWARTRRGWDVAFYGMTAVSAAALAVQPRTDRTALTTGLLTLGVLVVAYLALARPAAASGNRRLVAAYLAVLVVAVVVVVGTNPAGTLLLFIAYSQVWFFAESRRHGVALSLVLTVGVFAAIAVRDDVIWPDGVAQLATQGGVALLFAVLLGLWVTQVAEQSEERADLIARLEATQDALARSHHAAGVSAERERMAREIHDTLAQGFTSVVMLAQTALADLDRGEPGRAAGRIALAERTARENLAEARALVAAFTPVPLDGSTLTEALGRLAARFEEETGLTVDVVLPADGAHLPRETEVVLLRAAQEALTNVRRHAQASRVRLVLRTGAGGAGAGASTAVELEVVDDGRGMGAATREGFGLRGMRERVASGGGSVAVDSPEHGGTRVQVRLPVATDDGRMAP